MMEFDPKLLDPEVLKAQMKKLGITHATLKQVAQAIQDIPELQAIFQKHAGKEGFESNVQDISKEVEEIFEHDGSTPDGKK